MTELFIQWSRSTRHNFCSELWVPYMTLMLSAFKQIKSLITRWTLQFTCYEERPCVVFPGVTQRILSCSVTLENPLRPIPQASAIARWPLLTSCIRRFGCREPIVVIDGSRPWLSSFNKTPRRKAVLIHSLNKTSLFLGPAWLWDARRRGAKPEAWLPPLSPTCGDSFKLKGVGNQVI